MEGANGRPTWRQTSSCPSKASSISNANISQIETGQRTNITIETLLKLSQALSVSTDYLLGLREDMEIEIEAAEAA